MSDNGSNHRLNYFNNQFLLANDFADEQKYHLYKRRLHNTTLHTPGIAEGLDVRIDLKDPKTLTVSKGIAIDSNGNEIVLSSEQQVSLPLPQPNDPATNVMIYVSIAYSEEPPKDAIPEFIKMWQPEDADRGSNQYTRTIEKAVLKATPSEDKEAIQLAIYNYNSKELDLSVRLKSSAKLSATQDLTTPEANSDQVYPTAMAVKTYVDSKILKSSSVSTDMLANGAVTSEKIANGAITQDKLDSRVTTVRDGSIDTVKLGAEAVTNDKIKKNTITIDKLNFTISANPWKGDTQGSIYFANDVGIGLNSPPMAAFEIQAAASTTAPEGDGGYIRFFDKSGRWMYECSFSGGTDGQFNFVNTGVIGGETAFLATSLNKDDKKVLRIMNSGDVHIEGNAYSKGAPVQSSRELKQDISDLSLKDARSVLAELIPVRFKYRGEAEKKSMLGFIAEDVPKLVATSDNKAIHALNIVAVLTKIAQHQQEEIARLHSRLTALEAKV